MADSDNNKIKHDDGEGEVLTKRRIVTKEPPLYRVILLNDHYTTMEFVVQILQMVFHKNELEAEEIMLNVHQRGAGTAGIYTKEIAETKTAVVHQLAKENQYPLRCTIEPDV